MKVRQKIVFTKNKKIKSYHEPFLGGGALFFYLVSNYKIKEAFLYDINPELILTYNEIKNNVSELINQLHFLQEEFYSRNDVGRKEYYYNIREKFNAEVKDSNYSDTIRASQLIFLNKTCFNGLFRLNKSGEFNVPMGKYKKPCICDEENIWSVHRVLKIAKIFNESFLESEKRITGGSLVYLDPPYRPLNKTSNFTSYSENGFDDKDQIELRDYFDRVSRIGSYAILSNSDPKNTDPSDNFFDTLYSRYKIVRIQAKRFINTVSEKRGPINEILVRNY